MVHYSLIVPWPTIYETLRTQFVKNRSALVRFEQEIRSSRVVLLDDTPYREDAFALSLRESVRGRHLSMVDCMIRLVIEDVSIRIDRLATYNAKDFVDLCAKRRIMLWPVDAARR